MSRKGKVEASFHRAPTVYQAKSEVGCIFTVALLSALAGFFIHSIEAVRLSTFCVTLWPVTSPGFTVMCM